MSLCSYSNDLDTEMKRVAVHLTQRRGGRTKPQQKVSKFKGKGRKEISQVRRQCHCCQDAENQWRKSRMEKNEIFYRKRHTLRIKSRAILPQLSQIGADGRNKMCSFT